MKSNLEERGIIILTFGIYRENGRGEALACTCNLSMCVNWRGNKSFPTVLKNKSCIKTQKEVNSTFLSNHESCNLHMIKHP